MPPHCLTSFGIQKYYQNELKFNGIYSRKYFPKVKDGAYVINREKYESIETHWMALYVNGDNEEIFGGETYLYRFGFEHIQQEIKKFIDNRKVTKNVFSVRAHN